MRQDQFVKGEQDRVRILQFMTGKTVTNQELREGLNMTKHQIDHHMRRLIAHGYVVNASESKAKFMYKRTRATYKARTLTIATKPEKVVEVYDVSELPTVSNAKVYLNGKRPASDYAWQTRKHKEDRGIGSGMALFGEL